MEQLRCKLTEYVILYSGKLMWGMDCDLEPILQEISKIEYYLQVLETLETTNSCTDQISTNITQKINSYISLLNRKRKRDCRNCS